MRIVWSRGALADLGEIERYITSANPEAARAVKDRIRERVGHLAQMPGAGRLGRVPDTRELVIAGLPYVVAYAVDETWIRIVAVIHAARRSPEAF